MTTLVESLPRLESKKRKSLLLRKLSANVVLTELVLYFSIEINDFVIDHLSSEDANSSTSFGWVNNLSL